MKTDQLCVFHSCYQPTNQHFALVLTPNFLCSANLGLLLSVCLLHWFVFFPDNPPSLYDLPFSILPLTPTGSFSFLPLSTYTFMSVGAPSPLWLQCPLYTRPDLQGRALAQLWLSLVPPCAWALLSPSGVRKSLLPVSAGKLVYPPPTPGFHYLAEMKR